MCINAFLSQTEAEVEAALSQLREEGARVEAEGACVREEGERVKRERQALERDRERMEAFGTEIQHRAQEIEEMCQVAMAVEYTGIFGYSWFFSPSIVGCACA